ncbi:MAG: hypothetical protein KY462_03930 [Actinobacteria bacterium]|nr:hypothetical protein [Actinomycetota bacterium]
MRVFEPLDAFPPSERERWRRYVAADNGVPTSSAQHQEATAASTRLVTGRAPTEPPTALVRRVADQVHVCPLQLAERHAAALLAFRQQVPDPAADQFFSREEMWAAAATVDRLMRPPHIREASWEVPLQWFAAFDAAERRFRGPSAGRSARLAYLTTVEAALDRLDRAISVVEARVDDGGGIGAALTELVDWLANFHDDSLLELDYGGLATTIPAADLATDLSCEDLWATIDNLERGHAYLAVSGYEALQGRWQLLRIRCRTN